MIDTRRLPDCHRDQDYTPSRRRDVSLRAEGGRDGVLYRSVRHEGGLCAAVSGPRLLSPCPQSPHCAFHFDGTGIIAVDEMQTVWNTTPL